MVALVDEAARTDGGRPLHRLFEIACALETHGIDVDRAIEVIMSKLGAKVLFCESLESQSSRVRADLLRFNTFAARPVAEAPRFGEEPAEGSIRAGSLGPPRRI
jgi:hypothetical protein